jgi:DNA polymerase elongation subunit (family B)
VSLAERFKDLAPRPPRVLTLDIETSPNIVYAWGLWGQNIAASQVIEPSRVLCFAAKWLDAKRVEFYSEHHHDRAEMVAQAWRLLDEADVVVGYNHVRFDIPHLQREFILAGLRPPSPWHDVDLLTVNRNRFKFTSNKLGYVTEALGLPTKMETGGQALWSAVMAGDARAWEKFKRYNVTDVKVTETLFTLLSPWIKHPHRGQWSGDLSTCYACGGRDLTFAGVMFTKTTAYPKAMCSCGALNRVLRNGQTRAA